MKTQASIGITKSGLRAATAMALLFGIAAQAATITVVNTNDNGAGSFRYAVTNARAGSVIVFDPSITGMTITLTSGEIVASQNLTIQGPGSSQITISGNNAGRILHTENAAIELSGLTFANGKVTGGNGAQGNGGGGGGGGMGGGLLADAGSVVTIRDVVFTNCTARGGNGGANGSAGGGAAGGAGKGGLTGALAAAGQANFNGLGGAAGANEGGGGGGSASGIGAGAAGGNGSFGGGGGGGGASGSFTPLSLGGLGGTSGGFGGQGGQGGYQTTGGGGGGGAGLGGAICVWQDAELVTSNVTFINNTATGGAGANGGSAGQGKGAGVFVCPGGVALATNLIFSGNNSQNAGTGSFVADGLVHDSADIYGSFLNTVSTTTNVIAASANLWYDDFLDVTSDDTNSVPGEAVNIVGNLDPYGAIDTALIKFDLSSITGTVTSAKLQIHICDGSGSPSLSVYGISNDSWTELNLSTLLGTVTSLLSPDSSNLTPGDWKSIDVTPFVTSKLSGDDIASFELTDGVLGLDAGGDYFAFDARAAIVAAARPTLFITTSNPPPTTNTLLTISANAGTVTWGTSVNFNVSVSSLLGDLAPLGLIVFKDNGVTIGSSSLTALLTNSVAALNGINLAVGTNNITAEFPGLLNILGSTNGLTITVLPANQAPLSFSAPTSLTFGTTNSLSLSGGSGVGSVSYSILSGPGEIVDGTNLVATGGVGSIVVQATKGPDADYSPASTNATVTCLPAIITIPDLRVLSKTYNGTVAATFDTNVVLDGLVSGADVWIDWTSAYANFESPDVGTNIIVTFAGLQLAGPNATNYVLSLPAFVTANISASNAAISIRVTNFTYDGTPKAVTFATTPLNLPLSITYDGSSMAPSAAGNYSVTASVTDSNYLASVTTTLVISQAPLSVTAANVTRPYGATNPVLTGTIIGLAPNDSITPTFTCTADRSSPAGTYHIVAGILDPLNQATNYIISTTNGTLTVTVALMFSGGPDYYIPGSGASLVDTNAFAADGGGINFAGGTISFIGSTNADSSDFFTILTQGTNANQISLQDDVVSFGGQPIATTQTNAGELTITFGTNSVDSTTLSALLRQVTFATGDTNEGPHEIQVVLDYGDNSVLANLTIALVQPSVANPIDQTPTDGTNDLPTLQQIVDNTPNYTGGSNLTLVSFTSTNGGTLTLQDSALVYQASTNYMGTADSITYRLSDGEGDFITGTLTVTLLPLNVISLAPAPGSTNTVQFQMGGIPRRPYNILSSTDLIRWSFYRTINATPAGVVRILFTISTNHPAQFFQAALQ